MAEGKKLKSDIALIESERVVIHGLDLCRDIMGKVGFGDAAFLQIAGRLPTPRESVVFNAIAVTFMEHGIEPATIAARMVYSGAPDAIQSAIAAGLCAMGSGMPGSMQNVARMLQLSLPDPAVPADLEALAGTVVEGYPSGQGIPGMGHDVHTMEDPRSSRLFQIAREQGFDGSYTKLMRLIARRAGAAAGKPLPLNAAGAVGAVACELRLPWQIVRGIAVMARAAGLIGHILEEIRDPMALEIRARVDKEATAHLRGKWQPGS